MRYEELMKQVIGEYEEKGIVDANSFPEMELYMDQAALLLNKRLALYEDNGEEPLITKTMISNYSKHKMMPRPVGKKYTKDHLIMLTLIFYLKGGFQMQEIKALMKPFILNYESEFDEKFDFTMIYESITTIVKKNTSTLSDDVQRDIKDIKKLLSNKEFEDDDTTELFMLVSVLIMQADAQKFLAHKLLEEYFMEKKKK